MKWGLNLSWVPGSSIQLNSSSDWFFYKGEKVRIVNFEKPYHEFAGHCVVQSLYSGRVTKTFKHELCIGEPVNEDPEWADTDFLNPSQSDEELSCIDEIANGDC
jgi:hypothetical protein